MSIRIRSLLLAASLWTALFSGAVLAALEAQVIDVAHSTLDFTAVSALVDAEGTFKEWKGEVNLDRQDITKSTVNLIIDAKSIDTRIEKRNDHLRSADFLDVAKYPTITFKSTKITRTGEKTFDITGDFTLHGVTKSITIPATIDRLGDPYSRFRTEFKINRKTYGVNYDSSLNPIEDELKVRAVINIRKPL